MDPIGQAIAAVTSAVKAADGGGGDAYQHLVGLLGGIDMGGNAELGTAVLEVLGRAPGAVVGLDQYLRREGWRVERPQPAPAQVLERLDRGTAGPVAVVLAGMHRDGRVRERAVRAMAARPGVAFAPFLVLRAADWVEQVRGPARAAVTALLVRDPVTYVPLVLPTALRIEGRVRGGFVRQHVVAELLAAPPELRRTLATSGGTAQRRLVFGLDRAQGRHRLADLVALAESDTDTWIRAQAADAACREAVWTEQVQVLRRLVRGRRTQVRVTALVGLLRLGRLDDVTAYLGDASALARAVAREGARRAGTDAVAYYRLAVTGAGAALTPGAIAGYAETVAPEEVAPLFPLLEHPDAKIRGQAARGVRQLGGVTAERLVGLLRDPSPAVVREATAALRPMAGRLPPGLPWELFQDSRPEVRRAGYRLLNGQATPVRLTAALTLALDADPALARRGVADVTGLARAAGGLVARWTARVQFGATDAQRAELTVLAERAAERLGEQTHQLLLQWLARDAVTAGPADAP